jgi:chaperone modulatory protein CbpM
MPTKELLQGLLLDEQVNLSLSELCRLCGTPAESLLDMVDEGLIEPIGDLPQWRFSSTDVQRARIALNLQYDLGINLAGVAMVLDLLEEVHDLRRRVRHLEYQLFG